MQRFWTNFQNSKLWYRLPAKSAVILLTTFVVCYPYPHLFARNVSRWRDPNSLIEPDAPGLTPMLADLKPQLADVAAGPDALKIVERYVYRQIPYGWDWDVWGVVDYWPTVAETLAAGREDCDGQAVVSASILRNLGYNADLVTDTLHVWVKTDRGETMSPGQMPKLLEADDEGVTLNWAALANIPRSAAFGLSVFPMWRELVVVLVVWLLALRPGMRPPAAVACLAVIIAGLAAPRIVSHDPLRPNVTAQWIALITVTVGLFLHQLSHHHARRRTTPAPDHTTATPPVPAVRD